MRTQPKSLIAMAAILTAIAVSYPVQVMFLYEHSMTELYSVLSKLAPLNWLVAVGCLFASYLAFRASPWMWVVFPVLSFFVAWNNWLVGSVGADFSATTTALATLGFTSLGSLMFSAQAWEILLHPEKRWWLRPERKQVSAPVFVIPKQGDAFRAETFDISATGAFIPLASESALLSFNTGDKISLRLTMGALTVLRCEAQVIRRNAPKGHYPAGVGIQFLNMNRHDSKELRKYLSSC
ncbi:MAG TPA: PilZ domain-containing protein [Bdellovibrionales bacterium]|nr:PilZ domain-containing protein [Bdellovibrionales bacterium]